MSSDTPLSGTFARRLIDALAPMANGRQLARLIIEGNKVVLTQAQYDALATKDPLAEYMIVATQTDVDNYYTALRNLGI